VTVADPPALRRLRRETDRQKELADQIRDLAAARRLSILELRDQGWTFRAIADALGVTVAAVANVANKK
jgi:DNA-binding NarL/FixJ family response regulator